MSTVNVDVKRMIGAIGDFDKAWKKELNVVSWNDKPAKYDIRNWDENHEKMGKGITLSAEEAKALYELLKEEFDKESA